MNSREKVSWYFRWDFDRNILALSKLFIIKFWSYHFFKYMCNSCLLSFSYTLILIWFTLIHSNPHVILVVFTDPQWSIMFFMNLLWSSLILKSIFYWFFYLHWSTLILIVFLGNHYSSVIFIFHGYSLFSRYSHYRVTIIVVQLFSLFFKWFSLFFIDFHCSLLIFQHYPVHHCTSL